MANPSGKILALAGGVGGAKLALGLAGVLPNEALTVVVNTADDFEHLRDASFGEWRMIADEDSTWR